MVDSLLGGKSGKRKPGNAARLTRSIVLGAIAVAFAIYWLARSYGVDTDELLGYLKTSILFVGFFVGAGILGGMLLWVLRRFRR